MIEGTPSSISDLLLFELDIERKMRSVFQKVGSAHLGMNVIINDQQYSQISARSHLFPPNSS